MKPDLSDEAIDEQLVSQFHAAFDVQLETPTFRRHIVQRPGHRRRSLVVGTAVLLLVAPAAAALSQSDLVQSAFRDMGVRDKSGAPANYRLVMSEPVSTTLTVRLYSSSGVAAAPSGKTGVCYFTELVQNEHVTGGKGWCGTPTPDHLPTVVSTGQFVLVQSAAQAAGTARITSSTGQTFTSASHEGFAIFPPLDGGSAALVDTTGTTNTVDVP